MPCPRPVTKIPTFFCRNKGCYTDEAKLDR